MISVDRYCCRYSSALSAHFVTASKNVTVRKAHNRHYIWKRKPLFKSSALFSYLYFTEISAFLLSSFENPVMCFCMKAGLFQMNNEKWTSYWRHCKCNQFEVCVLQTLCLNCSNNNFSDRGRILLCASCFVNVTVDQRCTTCGSTAACGLR